MELPTQLRDRRQQWAPEIRASGIAGISRAVPRPPTYLHRHLGSDNSECDVDNFERVILYRDTSHS